MLLTMWHRWLSMDMLEFACFVKPYHRGWCFTRDGAEIYLGMTRESSRIYLSLWKNVEDRRMNIPSRLFSN